MADGRRGDRDGRGLSRRELLAAGAVAGAALAADRAPALGSGAKLPEARRIVFDGPGAAGWGGAWRSVGVANLRREDGRGVLEAGSDVFPNDPRPVAFLVDHRVLDAELSATVVELGDAAGAVLRRTGPRHYYAAVLDTTAAALRLLVRDGDALAQVASAPFLAATPLTLTLRASGTNPTALQAEIVDAAGRRVAVEADDDNPALQSPGDPGLLATAQTLFPSDPNPVLPALGNVHLLPWSVQEGQAVMSTIVGQVIVGEIRRRSTAVFSEVRFNPARRPRRTRPSVLAAFAGPPVPGGARLNVAADIAARVEFELSTSPRFERSRTVSAGRTGSFHSAAKTVGGLPAGRRIYWRPRLERHGITVTGPVRSFRNGARDSADGSLRLAVAACGSQFGPIFDRIADSEPDVLVWQGDLNYPDTHGPLAQTMSGYAGIWRDFLANPRLSRVLGSAIFAAQRDDHDYGTQDANSTTIPEYPWALAPWEALVNKRTFYRFPAGAAEVWVLDQRRFKSDPAMPDGPQKTLLGRRQLRWLLRTLAASTAPFKLICSPATVFMPANARDGNWATGYETERELLLGHLRDRVDGTTVFLTGDTHLTGVFDAPAGYEVRAAPVGIPKPNDVTLLDPFAAENLRGRSGVVYAGDQCHFTVVDVRGRGRGAELALSLVREDGKTVYSRSF